jgi:intracellular septation protein
MKLLIDFFPIVLFFIAFKWQGIYVATATAIVATVVQLIWLRRRQGHIEPLQWTSLVVIVVFGGATLLLHNETFIKWKPSVLYWVMALALWGGQVFFKRNGIQLLMGAQVSLPPLIWQRLLHAWAVFFVLMGVLNLWVAYRFDTDTWVNFKLFGGMGLMLVFVVLQAIYMGRHLQASDAPADTAPPVPGDRP